MIRRETGAESENFEWKTQTETETAGFPTGFETTSFTDTSGHLFVVLGLGSENEV